jgi:hypothetical protein
MAFEVTKSIGAAGIGQAVRLALLGMLGGSGGGSVIPGAGAVGKVAPLLGMGGAAVGVALAANAALEAQGASETAQNKGKLQQSTVGTNVAMDLFAKARAGTVTPDDISGARAAAGSLEGLRGKQQEAVGSAGWNMWSGMFGSVDRQKNAEAELKNTEKALQLLQGAIQASAAALRAHANAASNPGAPTRSGGPMSSPLRGGATN